MGAESSSIAVFGDELDQAFAKEVEPEESTVQFVKRSYTRFVRRIVEPERKAYERSALGPDSFEFAGVGWRKRELTLTTTDGIALQAVHWEPAEKLEHAPVTIYMHSASCAMDDAVEALFVCTRLRMPVLAFDFRCCGRSEGAHVSFDMRNDLSAALEFVQSVYSSTRIVLWGRGTGAAAAMQYLSTNASTNWRLPVCAVVLDSPFKSVDAMLSDGITKLQAEGYWIPSPIMKLGFNIVRHAIRQQTSQDPYTVKPIEYASSCRAPACVLISTADDYVSSKQSLDVANAYNGTTVRIMMETTHFQRRPVAALLGVEAFLSDQCGLQIIPGADPHPETFVLPWRA